jgi:hypothetical protein
MRAGEGELAAQPGRVGVERAGAGACVDGVAPHLDQQLVLGEDALGLAGRLVQQGKLEPRQLKRPPGVVGLEAAGVDAQRPDRDALGAAR